jgi:hypothetical protein
VRRRYSFDLSSRRSPRQQRPHLSLQRGMQLVDLAYLVVCFGDLFRDLPQLFALPRGRR